VIDKTIGVIPPRNERSSFPDKKAENSKEQKSEFESLLNQSSRQSQKSDKNERSDQALGGTKKKVQDTDQKLAHKSEKTKKSDNENQTEGVDKKRKKKLINEEMVLNSMDSIESANKTPDSEVSPDHLEKINLSTQEQVESQALSETESQVEAQAETQTEALTESLPEEVEIIPDSKVLETLNREQLFQKLEEMKKTEDLSTVTKVQDTMDVAPDTSSLESADQGQDDLRGDDQDRVQLGSVQQHQSHVAKDFSQVAANAQVNKPEVAQDADAVNLKEILNQAHYLVTQGGGEVSVKMTPEGMGEVQLKIMLENGKMNLEMNTHDKNVQKLIQDSLSDLKSSLAAHQISVEHVTLNNKISTVQDTQNAQSSQNFTDAHAHQQSQHSHQRDQRQQAGLVFQNETMKAVPLAKSEINKASAHRVYQNNKANSLNAVA